MPKPTRHTDNQGAMTLQGEILDGGDVDAHYIVLVFNLYLIGADLTAQKC